MIYTLSLLIVSTSLGFGVEASSLPFIPTKECPLTANCCEEDCCGQGTRWSGDDGGYCVGDSVSPGFNGTYSQDWTPGCIYRACCGATCCSQGMQFNDELGLCLPGPVCTSEFSQLGESILGEQGSSWFGTAISLSADGSIVAVGAPFSGGHVRIFRRNGNDWNQLGNTLRGVPEVEPPDDNVNHEPENLFGESVSLSSDGTIVAIGFKNFGADESKGGNGAQRGKVEIHKWTGNEWELIGEAIEGENAYDAFGQSVSLSGDGTVVAIGFDYNAAVFQWNGRLWKKVGENIYTKHEGEFIGESFVSLASQGQIHTLAIGNPGYADELIISPSRPTRIFKWNIATESWEQAGTDIRNDEEGSFGRFIALSSSGHVIAIGISTLRIKRPRDQLISYFQVFKFNGSEWIQQGDNVYGEEHLDFLGRALAISGDGTVVAAGARDFLQGFQWNGTSWNKLGKRIDGATFDPHGYTGGFGISVALSADGRIVAGGAPHFESRTYGGAVQVFSCK